LRAYRKLYDASKALPEEHHLFPQAREFMKRFKKAGINVHYYAMMLPYSLHRALHTGPGKAGRWLTEWSRFFDDNPTPSRNDVLRHVRHLITKYDLTGYPIKEYRK
jgi:uncharacterized lipoprotein (TIGR02269 family)